MEGKNLVENLERLRSSLEALQKNLVSTAYSLENMATSLENVHLASSHPDMLKIREEAELLIDRLRCSS